MLDIDLSQMGDFIANVGVPFAALLLFCWMAVKASRAVWNWVTNSIQSVWNWVTPRLDQLVSVHASTLHQMQLHQVKQTECMQAIEEHALRQTEFLQEINTTQRVLLKAVRDARSDELDSIQ